MSEQSVPLPVLYKRALNAASESFHLPTIQEETQKLIKASKRDLEKVSTAIDALSLFSSNETLDDLATGDLIYLVLPYLLSEVTSRLGTPDESERRLQITISKRLLKQFIETLENYSIVSEHDIQLARGPESTGDFAKSRELRIEQARQQKQLQEKISSVRSKWSIGGVEEDDGNEFALCSSLLQVCTGRNTSEDVTPEEETIRSLLFSLLRLFYSRAHGQLRLLDQELELLAHQEGLFDRRDSKGGDQDDLSWRLDALAPGKSGPSGPLLDSSGKPLRPFTILPSTSSSERSRLRAEVFRPDHRLPTMTIDEYLEEEQRRGNIISGGGPKSWQKLTDSEQLALDAEMDGTVEGHSREEEKRQKDENWARWTDEHPKGIGNTMNRG